ncbi:MAG: hypothetical protein ACI9LG_001825 [Moritella dasanensis]|jgi:hypothetical protein
MAIYTKMTEAAQQNSAQMIGALKIEWVDND